jgi:hypothetical protein
MSESKFVILGGGIVAGYSAWSNRFEAGRVGNSIGGFRPWNHPASQIMDVSEFCTWSVHGSRSRASRNNQLVEAELRPRFQTESPALGVHNSDCLTSILCLL